MIEVTNTMRVYEIDHRDVTGPADQPPFKVHSHWNRSEFVVIEVEGKQYTVVARDLLAAIQNAQNTGRR